MPQSTTYPVPPAAIAVPLLAFATLILDMPPLVWHIRNRNLAAASLVSWILLTNLMNFVNALLWPTDDVANWWPGYVFCDMEVKLMTAVYIGVVASMVCIMRNLAKVLDTKNTVLYPSRAQRKRQTAIDLLSCFGLPGYMMVAHYIVQPNRYYIFTIAGCTPSFDRSWPKLVLIFIWPPIFCLVVVYYSGTSTSDIPPASHYNRLTYASAGYLPHAQIPSRILLHSHLIQFQSHQEPIPPSLLHVHRIDHHLPSRPNLHPLPKFKGTNASLQLGPSPRR